MKSVKRKWNKGFTMAEMLMVVAIIIVLLAVGVVAVQRHQRSLYQVDFDGIAREIYFAAQNHLTQADTQGLVAKIDASDTENNPAGHKVSGGYMNPDDDTLTMNDVYYYAFPADTKSNDNVLGLMLPDFAVDTTSSVGGSGTFFILYQKSTATVLDVFYSSTDNRFGIGKPSFETDDYGTLIALRDTNGNSQKNARRSVSYFGGGIIGYYGGEKAQEEIITLEAPELKVENGDKLKIIITNPNTGANLNYTTLQLVVTGVRSKKNSDVQPVTITILKNNDSKTASPTFSSDKSYIVDISKVEDTSKDNYSVIEIVLDDITNETGHFASIFPTLIPGEDIQVQAKVFSTNTLANIAWSAVAVTNSLFADPYSYTEGKTVLGSAIDNKVGAVSSFRHLENLDGRISSLGKNDNTYELKNVSQIADIDWLEFRNSVKDADIKPFTDISVSDGCYIPVTPQYESNTLFALTYDGQNHSASNVKVDYAGDAGLFGSLTVNNSAVKNLELIDFDVTASSGNAGALVGTTTSTTITNVLAHHTDKTDYKTATVTATTGSVGGLIGSATGCTVSKSAAALVVSGSTNAGGLIGSSSGGTVTACYSGGHTYSGAPATGTAVEKYSNPHTNVYPVRYYDANNAAMYNVTATTNAGGLIGSASSTAISYSYSTCSASAENAGGLVGTGTDNTIKYCYCTGLIPDQTNTIKTHGAFAGSLGGNQTIKGCKYFEIVNEYRETKDNKLTSGYRYLEKLGNSGTNAEITAFDASADSYNGFSPAKDEWGIAYPYDQGGNAEETNGYGLKVFYKNGDKTGYNLQTVQQVFDAAKKADSSITDTIEVETTDFVKDHYGDWPAPEEFIFVSN